METFGVRLRQLRKPENLEDFAARFSIPPGTMGNYERDRNQPPFALVQKLCSHFGVKTEWLLFGTGPKYEPEKTTLEYVATPKPGSDNELLVRILQQERAERQALSKENSDLREKIGRLEERLEALAGGGNGIASATKGGREAETA